MRRKSEAGESFTNQTLCEGLARLPLAFQPGTHWRYSLAIDVLGRLRGEFAQRRPGLWSVGLQIDFDSPVPDALYTQETLLGEFLRAVRRHEAEPHLPLALESFLSPRHAAGELASAVAVGDPVNRAELLREVALLGSKLLSGEETPA